jgi:hypothetical protein
MGGLANIPFYGAYAQRREMNEQAPMQELKQASGAIGLMGALQEQQQQAQLRQALAESGGDVEAAMRAAIASGNLAGAAKLAPILEERRKAQPQPRVMGPGSQLVGPNNEILHTVPHRPANPPAPPGPTKIEMRL